MPASWPVVLWRRAPTSVKAAAFLAIFATIGLALGTNKSGHSSLMVPLIWAFAGWYVAARSLEGKAHDSVKRSKFVASLIATLLSPFLLCSGPLDVNSVADYVVVYGWSSNQVGHGGRTGFIAVALMLAVFLTADIAEMLTRRRI